MTKKKLQQKITEMIKESEKRYSIDHDEEIQKRPQKYLAPHPLDYNFDKCFFIYDNAKELHKGGAQTLIDFCNQELEKEAKKTDIDYQKVFYLSHIMELNRNELDRLSPMIEESLIKEITYYNSHKLKTNKIVNYEILCDFFKTDYSSVIEKSHTRPW